MKYYLLVCLSVIKTFENVIKYTVGVEAISLLFKYVGTLTLGDHYNSIYAMHDVIVLLWNLQLSLANMNLSVKHQFIITLDWLYDVLKDIPPDKWSDIVIS